MKNNTTLEKVRQVKQTVRVLYPNASFGITRLEDGYAIRLNFPSAPTEPIPSEIDGVPVLVEIVGILRPRI